MAEEWRQCATAFIAEYGDCSVLNELCRQLCVPHGFARILWYTRTNCASIRRLEPRLITVCGPDAAVLPDGDVRILCAHNPRVWKTAQHVGYDLVLAGHLHGCQFVAFEYRDRLFPGAIFYPYCYLTHQRGSTRLVVSRGISDLVPVRWRCPREVVLCYV